MTERTMSPKIVPWPVTDLVAHPENPRSVNNKTERFNELLESIRASGVLEPLTVRVMPSEDAAGTLKRQVLSGHRRLAAATEAGLDTVPVRDLGTIADDLAYDIVAMANLHEDLTPLEEGKRVALWLDKYKQDAKAVASKLGKTESWVVQHAQIDRGLTAEWKRHIAEAMDHEDRPEFARWTAGHLAVLARLPVALQTQYLKKVQTEYRWFSCGNWTVKHLQEQVKIDLLYLAKAPFDEGTCDGCMDRTDRVLGLFGPIEENTGDKTRCLNPRCWARKCSAHAKREFKETAAAKGVPDAVPVSLIEPPKDYYARQGYDDKVRPLKKAFPGLVTADRIEVVKAGTKGAVPAIVVGGRGKNSVRYVKVVENKTDGGGAPRPTAAELARQKAEDEARQRKIKVTQRVYEQLSKAEQPDEATVLYACLCTGFFPGQWPDEIKAKEIAAWRKIWYEERSFPKPGVIPKSMCRTAVARLWTGFTLRCRERAKVDHHYPDWWKQVLELGPIFGISPDAELAKLTEKQETPTEGTESTEKRGRGRPRGSKDKVKRKSKTSGASL